MSSRGRREPDPEQRRRQAHASELMLAVAARLLGEARLAGAFPTDPGGLAGFAARLRPELEPGEHIVAPGEESSQLPRADFKVVLDEPEAEAVGIGCAYRGHRRFGRLRIDGVLDEQGGSVGISVDDPEARIELTPLEQEVMRRAFARRREDPGRLGRPRFAGTEFLRAIVVAPQPQAAAQILAVELYGDGLVVRYTYDDPVEVRSTVPLGHYELAEIEPPIDELRAEAEAEGGNLEPNVSVRDDVGTRYVLASGGRGGVEVAHGEAGFAPAVPPTATRLVVSSYAGTVEVDL